MEIEITSSPQERDDDFVISETRKYNSQFVKKDVIPISVYYRGSDGNIIAGLTGKTFWNWLHIEYLWVQENQRGNGLGSKLILAAEDEAVKRGCRGSTLDTFSFQAPGFYKKMGYSIIGSLSGYSGDRHRHYLEKDLTYLTVEQARGDSLYSYLNRFPVKHRRAFVKLVIYIRRV